MYPFSLEPYRVAELVWPNVFGSNMNATHSWLSALPPSHTPRFWVPMLYVGGLALILALGAARLRKAPAPTVWLVMIGFLSLMISMGECASPLWLARTFEPLRPFLGPHDPPEYGALRRDGYLPDGFGSPYWFLATVLPGFHSFRYPSKFLVFTSLSVAGLTGLGWDLVVAGRGRRARVWALGLGLIGLAALAASYALQDTILEVLRTHPGIERGSSFGPFDAVGSLNDTRRALLQGSVVLLISAALIVLATRRPRTAGGLALIVLTADLALANTSQVYTVPQSLYEGTPEVLALINKAESDDPTPGGLYRIHRMPLWNPSIWTRKASTDRVRDFVRWERKTIQPKYAIPFHREYTLTEGTAELYDYWFFFAPWGTYPEDKVNKAIGLAPGEQSIYYPRRGFDLWNTRYFVLPAVPHNDERRAICAFLPETKPIFPLPDQTFVGPERNERQQTWALEQDWQILRNEDAFPRAWVVHQIDIRPPITGMSRKPRQPLMEEILYKADPFWNSPTRILHDPKAQAWVETDDPTSIMPFRTGSEPIPTEVPVFTTYSPQRVEIDVTMEQPGLLVLADVYYPGWRLTIDGKPATIYRTNRLMRGAAVPSGQHHLVYTYEPWSFYAGLILSALGLVSLVGTGVWASRQRGAGQGTTTTLPRKTPLVE